MGRFGTTGKFDPERGKVMTTVRERVMVRVMLFWAALILVLTVVAMLPWFLGLLFIGPIVGHASWHAYRAAVVRDGDPDAQAPTASAA